MKKIPIILHFNVSFCEEIVPVIRILVLFASKPLSQRILFGPPIRISRWIHESVGSTLLIRISGESDRDTYLLCSCNRGSDRRFVLAGGYMSR